MCVYIYIYTHTDTHIYTHMYLIHRHTRIYTYIFNTHMYEIYTRFLGTKERLIYFNIITKTFPFIFLFVFNKKIHLKSTNNF